MRNFWALLVTLSCLLAPPPDPAAAHAVLLEAQPADGARLERPPAEIVLRFSEPIVPVAIKLLDTRGAEIAGLSVERGDQTIVIRPHHALGQGAYLLSYRVTSVDSHPIGAALRFGIGVDPRTFAPTIAADPLTSYAGVVARWLFYVTALGAAGLALFGSAVRPPGPTAGRARRLGFGMALTAVAAALLRSGIGALELTGLSPRALATAEPWAAVAGTSLAQAMAVAILGLTLLAVSLSRGPRWIGLSGALVVAGSFALTGHAATASPGWLIAPALAVHVACGAFWLGSLVPLLWSLALPPDQAHAVLRRFSAVATAVIGALLLAGALLAWIQLGGDPGALWRTDYGWRLMGKLALVAGLLGLAAMNRWRLTPAVARNDACARRALRRALGADIALGLGVLAVTATFPLDAPPRTAAAREAATTAPVTVLVTSRHGRAEITVSPGRRGVNRIEAVVTDASGALLTAQEASVEVAAPEAGIEAARTVAVMLGPGHYVAHGLALPLSGRWHLRLDLLVDDFTKLRFEGEVVLEEAGEDGVEGHHRRVVTPP